MACGRTNLLMKINRPKAKEKNSSPFFTHNARKQINRLSGVLFRKSKPFRRVYLLFMGEKIVLLHQIRRFNSKSRKSEKRRCTPLALSWTQSMLCARIFLAAAVTTAGARGISVTPFLDRGKKPTPWCHWYTFLYYIYTWAQFSHALFSREEAKLTMALARWVIFNGSREQK